MGYFETELKKKFFLQKETKRSIMGRNSFNYDSSISEIRKALKRGYRERESWMRENLMDFLPKIKVLKTPKYSQGEILLLLDIVDYFEIIPHNIVDFLDSKIGEDYIKIKINILRKTIGEVKDNYANRLMEFIKLQNKDYVMENYSIVVIELVNVSLRSNMENLGIFLFKNITTMTIDKINLAMSFGLHNEETDNDSTDWGLRFFNTYLESKSDIIRVSDKSEARISLAGKNFMMSYINWLKLSRTDEK
jgi:hypothetical protein